MPFQIHALDPCLFAEFFDLSDEQLADRQMCRMTVRETPGIPCRVSLMDAGIGDTVLLLNYEHQPARTAYRSCHAIFVRQGVTRAHPQIGEVPDVFLSRLISVRMFDAGDMMIDADVVAGDQLAASLELAFANPAVSYLHLHYAKPGCFAARVQRA